ncbi:type II secretion system F family protein [Vibrio tapetis]|uniref:TadB-like protein involved in pilus formation and/or protein secretion n=1 Tax=Vibrio tapetis subsp. tapetis TaxID=1671868 RepID=A0A2N8ZC83_9VIBR|nr:type II secretion system F family protein [Vibrio tapetis]SON49509.1 TadB-like protein involved in pilus formation and/or protein secretion [Vibrio tapetis subsp. tapetis]
MIIWVLILAGVTVLLLIAIFRKPKHNYLHEFNRTVRVESMTNDQAIDFQSLLDKTLWQRVIEKWRHLLKQIGSFAVLKIIVFACVLFFVGAEINDRFIRGNAYFIILLVEVSGFLYGYSWLNSRDQKQFEEAFPDALNMLASAVSAGESIMHAIMYVGKSLDSDVGAEFKKMGERLQMGETPDDVFRKACDRFPYPSFQFFVITLRANMHRGGQLKDVMTRLNRLMFDARAIEKKKFALTAEARTSAKIVAAIPFTFLFMLQYLSPDNYEFVMFHEDGRPILYYMLGSEFIGISIIWMLMKGVK